MAAYYELFDLRSANVMEHFATEREAWNALRQLAQEYGLEELEGLALSQSLDGQDSLIAMEDDIVRRVADALPPTDGDSIKTGEETITRVAS
jgi:hypothetical protein